MMIDTHCGAAGKWKNPIDLHGRDHVECVLHAQLYRETESSSNELGKLTSYFFAACRS